MTAIDPNGRLFDSVFEDRDDVELKNTPAVERSGHLITRVSH
jgi:hypothetical protein